MLRIILNEAGDLLYSYARKAMVLSIAKIGPAEISHFAFLFTRFEQAPMAFQNRSDFADLDRLCRVAPCD
jgi:hypothetical protein